MAPYRYSAIETKPPVSWAAVQQCNNKNKLMTCVLMAVKALFRRPSSISVLAHSSSMGTYSTEQEHE